MENDILYVIDLDRTLVDVEKVMEITEEVCSEMQIDFKKIYKDQQDLSIKGAAYSPFSYISGNYDIERFKKRFIELSKDDRILFSDSRKFVEQLRDKRYDFIILTYGVNTDWQMLKIEAGSLQGIPCVIVNDRNKGRYIKNWLDSQGIFRPGIESLRSYKKCIFIDDREETFIELPGNCRGYLLDRSGRAGNYQTLPPNIQIISSLSEVKL